MLRASRFLHLLTGLLLTAGAAAGAEPKRQEVLLLECKPPGQFQRPSLSSLWLDPTFPECKPARLIRLDLTTGRIRSSIPLDKGASYAVAHPGKPFVYVVHRARGQRHVNPSSQGRSGTRYKDPSRLSVVDLTSNSVIRTVELGKGDSEVRFSNSGDRVFCFSMGEFMTTRQETAKPANAAMVTVLNTRTHEVEATYRSDKSADEFFVSDDGERVFLFSSGTRWTGRGSGWRLLGKGAKRVPQELAVFGGRTSTPMKLHAFNTFIENSVLAEGRTKLVLVGRYIDGDQKGQGALQTLDLATGEISEPKPVGRETRRMFRLEDGKGLWLAGKQEISVLSEEGQLTGKSISLEFDDADADKKEIEGYPGRAMVLGDNRAVIHIVNRNGADKKRIALVDLSANRVQAVVPVGKRGVRIGREIGAAFLAAGLSAGASAGAAAVGSPYTYVFYVVPRPGFASVVKRADGRFCYALDPQSDDLTVVRASDGEIVAHLPFTSSLTLWAPPGSRYVLGLGEKEIEVLDTDTNRVDKMAARSGGVGVTVIDYEANELYVMGNKGLEVWSGTTGQSIKVFTDFTYEGVVQIILPGAGTPR